MDCPNPDQRAETWSAYLDGELDDARSASLREHLGQCAPCRAQLDELHRASAALAPLREITAPPSLRNAVERGWRLRLATPPLGLRFAAAAAGALLTIGLAVAIQADEAPTREAWPLPHELADVDPARFVGDATSVDWPAEVQLADLLLQTRSRSPR